MDATSKKAYLAALAAGLIVSTGAFAQSVSAGATADAAGAANVSLTPWSPYFSNMNPMGAPLANTNGAGTNLDAPALNDNAPDALSRKVRIMHDGREIEVSRSALDAHLRHGDTQVGEDSR